MFTKLKWELRILVLAILAILSFFVYGKVLEVQSFEHIAIQSEASVETNDSAKEILGVLTGIEVELSRSNCIAKAQGDAEEIAICN